MLVFFTRDFFGKPHSKLNKSGIQRDVYRTALSEIIRGSANDMLEADE